MRAVPFALIGALVSMSVAAHTQLSSSTPADGATLNAPPDELVLTFSEPVTLTAVSVHAADGVEHEIEALPREPAAEHAVAAPGLGPGEYSIDWRALSADTHVIDGTFTFTIETGALK